MLYVRSPLALGLSLGQLASFRMRYGIWEALRVGDSLVVVDGCLTSLAEVEVFFVIVIPQIEIHQPLIR